MQVNKNYKQIILGASIIIFAIFSWVFLRQVFYSDISLVPIILTILGLIFLGVAVCIGALVMDKKFVYSAFVLSLLSFIIFFKGSDIGPGQFRQVLYYLLIMILIFASFIVYRARVKKEKQSRTKMHFGKILKRGLTLVFIGICLLIGMAYYFSPALGQVSSEGFEIPRNIFDITITPFQDLISSRISQQELGSKSLNDELYNFVNTQINSSSTISQAIPIILAISLFFFLRILLIALIPIILLASSLIIKFLIAINFFQIITESVKAEKIEI